MKNKCRKFKKGAASFYIVAFSTLILVIIAASFASVIISAVTRTSNEDLSQSAYDSALAGVEDAKLAYMNYVKCVESGVAGKKPSNDNSAVTCSDIVYWMEHPDCDMVGHILGRIGKNTEGEVQISDTTSSNGKVDNNLNQAYTCATIQTTLSDYRSTLTTASQARIISVKFSKSGTARNISKIRISWYSNREGSVYNFENQYIANNFGRVAFKPLSEIAAPTPPTIAVGLIQTSTSFTLDQFDQSNGTQTNRATVYLVPTNYSKLVGNFNNNAWNGKENVVPASVLIDSNSHKNKNLPEAVYCNSDPSSEFACSTIIELPEPINGKRSDEAFFITVSNPYGQPDTDFSIEYFCDVGKDCPTTTGEETIHIAKDSDAKVIRTSVAGVQVLVDSTGRANDLYRRVEARLEFENMNTDYNQITPLYAIQLFGKEGSTSGSGSKYSLQKTLTVTNEWGS